MLNSLTTNYPKTHQALEVYRRWVLAQSKSRLTRSGHKASGELYSSLKGYISKRANRLGNRFSGGSTIPQLTFEMLQYGDYLDKGVRGSVSEFTALGSPYKFRNGKKAVNVGAIRAWCGQRGIPLEKAYPIARSIYQRGIARTLFFTTPFESRFMPMVNSVNKAMADDIATNIANKLKKKLKQQYNA